MGEITKIAWCDCTFNPWIGCSKVSAGCANCYAETLMDKRMGKAQWGPSGSRVRTSEHNWRLPRRWDKAAQEGRFYECLDCGHREFRKGQELTCSQCDSIQYRRARPRIFCASMCDVFEDRPELIPWRLDLQQLIVDTPSLDWLILTKRPHKIMELWPCNEKMMAAQDRNVWIGVSVENGDELWRINALCNVRAAVRFLSIEPMLGPLTIGGWITRPRFGKPAENNLRPLEIVPRNDLIQWVIVGGESGPGARPCNIGWIRGVVDQCKKADVPVFAKQLGAHPYLSEHSAPPNEWGLDWPEGTRFSTRPGEPQGCSILSKHPKGGDPGEWPESLRVRQFPNEGQ